jgi:hypothetical protein
MGFSTSSVKIAERNMELLEGYAMSQPGHESTEIVEAPLVSPADPKRVLEVMRRFEEFKRQALNQNDFVVLEIGKEKRPYIKKSGWMKYALACQLSLEKRDERLEERSDGSKVYHYTYRAVAPNGRFADAVGSASTSERTFSHPDHDVRSLAQTRACNRAISNLVAGGEVSAEEMVSEMREERERPAAREEAKTEGTTAAPEVPVPAQPSPSTWRVPITRDQAILEQIQQGVKQHAITSGTVAQGMVNWIILPDDLCEVSAVPEKPVPSWRGPIQTFLVGKFLEGERKAHSQDLGFEYELREDENGMLHGLLVRGRFRQGKVNEIINAVDWAFRHVNEPPLPNRRDVGSPVK